MCILGGRFVLQHQGWPILFECEWGQSPILQNLFYGQKLLQHEGSTATGDGTAQHSSVSLGEKVQHDLLTFHQSEQPTSTNPIDWIRASKTMTGEGGLESMPQAAGKSSLAQKSRGHRHCTLVSETVLIRATNSGSAKLSTRPGSKR